MSSEPSDSPHLSQREGRSETTPDKMLSIMDLFTPSRPEWTIEEMAEQLRLSPPTLYRYVRSLVSVGLVFSARPGRYLLGPGIIHYDRQMRLADPLIQAGQGVLHSLSGELEPPGVLFITRTYRDYVMSVHQQMLGSETFVHSYDRGRFMPLFSGAPSLAILAFSSSRFVKDRFFKSMLAKEDIEGRWRDLRRELRLTRGRGYALDAGQVDPAVSYVSVPLLRADGEVAGSLSLGLPSDGPCAIDLITARLGAAAGEIDRREQEMARVPGSKP